MPLRIRRAGLCLHRATTANENSPCGKNCADLAASWPLYSLPLKQSLIFYHAEKTDHGPYAYCFIAGKSEIKKLKENALFPAS